MDDLNAYAFKSCIIVGLLIKFLSGSNQVLTLKFLTNPQLQFLNEHVLQYGLLRVQLT